ncbi:hypothetical protein [Burkholderia cenocepacia]|uniref:hypothetical protein n=1 Tax=Burkholderia cenocepacia TaxID=95486 RepID=UPI000761DEB8|nr:hypothetical protein [Burkholderia cenocepacia]KWU24786.1 hypothetical protein AS149_32080 [Burkholderia cenocepacia]
MQIYQVGGAVRDLSMGLEPKDRDYVVVGSTASAMLAQGFRQVGKDFPVFLHPETSDEYALARVERKTAAGHKGFTVSTQDVTLEEDLSRRDLTVNSMAMDEDGRIIDPFGGLGDMKERILRHTSPAFSEDPLRILRIARFLARFGPQWRVADETVLLVRDMMDKGVLDELPFERIWKELERGVTEPHPEMMFGFMHQFDIFGRVDQLKPLQTLSGPEVEGWLQRAAIRGESAAVRFALACPCSPVSAAPEKERPQALPVEFWHIARAAHAVSALPAREFAVAGVEAQIQILGALDAVRRPARCLEVLAVLQVVDPFDDDAIHRAVAALRAIDKRALAAGCKNGAEVGAKLDIEQRKVLRELFA